MKDGISLVGGSGDDTFNYAVGNLSSADIIDGGGQAIADVLNVSGSGTNLVDSAFTNISHIEKLDISGLNANVTLGFSSCFIRYKYDS